jgi:stage V sporulation protein SpoVS
MGKPHEFTRVKASSPTTAIVGPIAGMLGDNEYVEGKVIGASAVNETIKVIAVAKHTFKTDAEPRKLTSKPRVAEHKIDGKERPSVRLIFRSRRIPKPGIESGRTVRRRRRRRYFTPSHPQPRNILSILKDAHPRRSWYNSRVRGRSAC